MVLKVLGFKVLNVEFCNSVLSFLGLLNILEMKECWIPSWMWRYVKWFKCLNLRDKTFTI
jgi:hypothetical protein